MIPVDSPFKERERRHSVMLAATVERFGTDRATVYRVRNLSASGACLGAGYDFRRGETLIVGVGALTEVGATVRWILDDLAGLAFAGPIDLTAALAKAAIRPKTAPHR